MSSNPATIVDKIKETKPWIGLRPMLPASPKSDILSGITVAIALVPEAVAFAFVAGVDPLIGLYSAFFIGLITAVLGGRPGMISGATGAMAVVVVALVAIHGVQYLFPAVILCGLIQITIGLLRLGKLIRMVPHPVMLGFVNGLAIVIGMAQIDSFKTLSSDGTLVFVDNTRMAIMGGLVLLTMGIIFFLPKLTKMVPSSLVAIVTVTLIAVGINSAVEDDKKPVLTVKDMLVSGKQAAAVNTAAKKRIIAGTEAATKVIKEANLNGPGIKINRNAAINSKTIAATVKSMPDDEVQVAMGAIEPKDVTMKGDFPKLFFLDKAYAGLMPPLNLETLWIILPFSLILAGVGLIESLMTMSLIDEIRQSRGRGNRECVGQGAANVVCGMFGGMGGCAMIGQSLINVKSGGKGRLSGITAAVCLLLFVLFLAPLIELIPMAALVGVMFMVVIGTFEWTTLKTWNKVPFADVLVMLFVAGYTVLMHDLASAVILGVVLSALSFTWKKSRHIMANTQMNEFGSKIYQIHGALFFASVTSFKRIFDVENDPEDVVIDFYFSRVYDQSGLEAINFIAEQYASAGKRLHLRHLSEDCQHLIARAEDLVEANISEDPHYHVATDRLG